MREIRFKAKRLNDGIWVEGDLVHIGNRVCIGGDNIRGGINDVDPSTVCQYTGLKNKDGKEIWEHDIVQETSTKAVSEVSWNNASGCYSLCIIGTNAIVEYHFADYPVNQYRVIGNRFDRKEKK